MPTQTNLHCIPCNKSFQRGSALTAHNKSRAHLDKLGILNDTNSKLCPKCGLRFMNIGFTAHNIACIGTPLRILDENRSHITRDQLQSYENIMSNPTNFDDVYRTKVIEERRNAPYTIEQYIKDYKNEIKTSISQTIKELGFTKLIFSVSLTYCHIGDSTNTLDSRVRTNYINLFTINNFKETFEDITNQLNNNLEIAEGELGESNLILKSIDGIKIDYWQTNPFKVKSFIELSFKSNHLVNIKNSDNKCFMWSILAALHPATDHPNRVSKYELFVNTLEFGDIHQPIQIKDVPKFEKLNNLRINVYMLEGVKNLLPVYISNSILGNVISLLIITDKEEENYHYVLIKNFQSFAKEQFTNHHGGLNQHICERCFYVTNGPRMKELHDRLCSHNKPARIEMPKIRTYQKDGQTVIKDDTKLSFKNYSKLLKPLATIYSDFEASNIKQNILHQYVDFIQKHKLLNEFNSFIYVPNENDEITYFNNILYTKIGQQFNITKILSFLSSQDITLKVPKYLSRHSILNRCLDYIERNKLNFNSFNYTNNINDEIIVITPEMSNKQYNINKLKEFMRVCGKPFTIKLTEQKASAYNIYVQSNYPHIVASKDFHYRGTSNEDTLSHFTKEVNNLEEKMYKVMITKDFKDPHLSTEQELSFQTATKCWMCDGDFIDLNSKVRDHDHFIREHNYRGAAHKECNIQCYKPIHIPFFFHNMTGYDIHLFIKSLAINNPKKIKVIGKTKEKYKAVDYGCVRFVDSLAFFVKSLDGVAKSQSNKDFKILLKEFLIPKLGINQLFTQDYLLNNINTSIDQLINNVTDKDFTEIFTMCRGKGIYCYDYIDSFNRYQETTIPPIEQFDSILNIASISNEEYERAQKMWELFDCQNLGDYTDLYLKLDVFILADCFEKFITFFPLNPCNYISAPSLSWDVLMYTSKETLDLIIDLDMFNMVKNNIRGGISSVMGNRRITAYNMKKDYQHLIDNGDPDTIIKDINQFNNIIKAMKDPSHILYIDATALYSGIMTCPMPYKDFKFITHTEDIMNEILSTSKDGENGYFIECDLKYPTSIHDKTKYFPFAPIKRNIKYEELSPWQQAKNPKKKSSSEKLICDQHDKDKYLVHYRLLQFYVNHGMEIMKVHNIISFKQKCWMKPFIENNIHKRAIAKSGNDDFGIDIYKLLNNSVFGKTMENIDKYRDIRLLTSSDHDMKQYRKIISKPTFKDAHKYSKDLIAVEVGNYVKTYNKPIYLGFSILDLSKLQMYETFYDVLLPHFGNRISINAMDTDSMFLHIKSEDIYKEIDDTPVLKQLINTSGALFSYKDEKPVFPIEDAIFMRAKQYSLKCRNDKNEIKNKGIQKCVVKKMTHINFIDCLESNIQSYQIVHSIRSDNIHNIYLQEQSKIALINYDDKRFILPDGETTLPFGHYSLEPNYINYDNLIDDIDWDDIDCDEEIET